MNLEHDFVDDNGQATKFFIKFLAEKIREEKEKKIKGT